METLFSLPYSEYKSIVEIQKYLSKKNGYAVFIPTSRQQKGVDFLIQNVKRKKIVSVQVKGSKPYEDSESLYRYTFWFGNFIKTYHRGLADVYLLFGLYPVYDLNKNIKSKTKFWKTLILVFTDAEMETILKQIRTKKTGKPDRFFYIAFTTLSKIVCTRGFAHPSNLANYVLEKRWKLIKKLLG